MREDPTSEERRKLFAAIEERFKRMDKELPEVVDCEISNGLARAVYRDDAFESLRAPESMLSQVDMFLSEPELFGVQELHDVIDYLNAEATRSITPQVRIQASYFESSTDESEYPGLYRLGVFRNAVDDNVLDSLWLVRDATKLPDGELISKDLLAKIPSKERRDKGSLLHHILLQPGDELYVDLSLLKSHVFDISTPGDFQAKFNAQPMHFGDSTRVGGVKNLYKLDREIHWSVDDKVFWAWRNYPAIREMKRWHSCVQTPTLPTRLGAQHILHISNMMGDKETTISLEKKGGRVRVQNQGPLGVVLRFEKPPKEAKPHIREE